ncbi:hypothetical protein CIPAW_07G010300 [Carya illinoinensis]|uniref:Protein kinase domain-containing protein n=1 Tax=Carya illinoinensis TaxID=32201 RepID=A0A8T1Q0D5_CARIL|nr:hypothetical protein CIPAW_07G010300 [Carya illinoinensis]
MGCLISRDVSSGIVSEVKEEENPSAQSKRKEGEKDGGEGVQRPPGERRRSRANPRQSNLPQHSRGEQLVAGWPPWLTDVCGAALTGLIPRRADSFEKIDKIGQGTYSNVYKARDILTGKLVALKKLEGLATSRMHCSLYLVLQYMEHDLAGLAASPGIRFTEAQVKCYMHQLLSGLEHCHNHGVLHRDIKGSNVLIDNGGTLKIADFGLASTFDPNQKRTMTSRVVTLWYRPPELLLGATDYGVGIDLWSAGCILAELLAGKPIMPGRTEVEQLHKIYKLCGSPTDEYFKKAKLPNATLFRPREPYKRCIKETFKDFPPSSLPLIDTLLAIDPAERLTATAALRSEFFTTEPYACEPSSLPKYPPSKEMDAKRRDDEARRLRAASKVQAEGVKKTRTRDRAVRAFPAPEANAELQSNLDRRRLISHANAKSKSEKFPPPHQDGQLGFPLGASQHIDPAIVPRDVPFSSTTFTYSKEPFQTWSGPLGDAGGIPAPRRKKHAAGDARETSKSQSGILKDRSIDAHSKGKKVIA